MSDQRMPDIATETETELWRTLRRGWVIHLEGAGDHRLMLFPGDAARLAMLLREAQPPEPGTSAAVRAYMTARPETESRTRGRPGRVDRLRATLARWVYDAVAP